MLDQDTVTAHPEDFCHKCGRPNVAWFAPSPLWNKAVRAKGEKEILCPVCFIQLAEAAGVSAISWAILPERPNGDYREAATDLAEWIGIHPKWSRESLVHTIEDAFADIAKQRAIDAAKEITVTALSAPATSPTVTDSPSDAVYTCVKCGHNRIGGGYCLAPRHICGDGYCETGYCNCECAPAHLQPTAGGDTDAE